MQSHHHQQQPRPTSSSSAVTADSLHHHQLGDVLSAAPSQTSTIVDNEAEYALEQEISRDERRIEAYGADDPEDPPQLRAATSPAIPGKDAPADPNLVHWDGPDDAANPQNWSRAYKWSVTLLCSLMTLNVTFASSAPAAATTLVQLNFDVSAEVSYLLTTVFLLGYVAGPILWGPGSEVFGRRPVFSVTMVLYALFILGQALAQNIQTLLVTRFFSGFFACAPLTNAGGVIADVWDPVTRGLASSLFTTMVFLGPVLGPIVTGFVAQETRNFRLVFWVMFAFAGACAVLAVVLLPETYAPKILEAKAKRMRREDPVGNKEVYAEAERQAWSFGALVERTVKRPFVMLAVEPILILVTVYLSVVYGVLYGLFEALPVVFITKHHFTLAQSGLVFIGVGLGAALGAAINVYATRTYPQLVKEWRGFPPPEKRLVGAMVAGPTLVVGALWLGWAGNDERVHWIVPALSTVLIGMSVSLVFISFISYLIDTYLLYAASALAANTVCRSAVGAAFPLFTTQMYAALGVQWASTLIACVALVLAPIPFLFYRYGVRIRRESRFAPGVDIKIGEAMEREREKEGKKVVV